MKKLFHSLLFFGFALFSAGCFETRTQVVVNTDGSGVIRGDILVSERMVVAMEAPDSPGSGLQTGGTVPFDEATLREQLGSGGELTRLEIEDQPDGSRHIRYELKVPDIIGFVNRQEEDLLQGLRFVSLPENRIGVTMNPELNEGDMNVPVEKMYGLMKGMYMGLAVTLPTPVERGEWRKGPNDRTVTWVVDLRNREGLDRLKKLQTDLKGKTLQASFPANGLKLPENSGDTSGAEPDPEVATPGTKDAAGLTATVAAVTAKRNQQLVGDERLENVRFYSLGDEQVELHVLLEWAADGSRPTDYETPVIQQAVSDTGENLLKEDVYIHSFRQNIHKDAEAAVAKVSLNVPNEAVTSLRIIKGYFPVIAGVERRTITIEDPMTKIGKGVLKHGTLQKLGIYLKSIDEAKVDIVSNGENIERVSRVTASGQANQSRNNSRFGMNDVHTYSFTFEEPVQPGDSLQLTVRLSENLVKVPFEARDVPLP